MNAFSNILLEGLIHKTIQRQWTAQASTWITACGRQASLKRTRRYLTTKPLTCIACIGSPHLNGKDPV